MSATGWDAVTTSPLCSNRDLSERVCLLERQKAEKKAK